MTSKVVLAVAALAMASACTPPAGAPSGPAGGWTGDMSATYTQLVSIAVTPSPIAATDVRVTRGNVTRIQANDVHGRVVTLSVADARPLALGNRYDVVPASQLDATGASVGAAMSVTEGASAWGASGGTVVVSLMAGPQVGCYFKGVTMSPSPGTTSGFNLDGQAQFILPSP